jgi:hypothetical protein
MRQTHLDHLVKAIETDGIEQSWVGSNVRSWWDYVTNKTPCTLPEQKVTRSDLKRICGQDSGFLDRECLAAVMAWGGQNRKHGQTLFKRLAEVEPIVSGLRRNRLNRWDAYQAFDDIWKSGEALGMGAAYFTKLIFFCEPANRGYIMDQWTSKSVNLIFNDEIVQLQQGYVSKRNTAENYRNFCAAVEELAKRLNLSGEDAEVAIFSKGGRNKGLWRKYVVENY